VLSVISFTPLRSTTESLTLKPGSDSEVTMAPSAVSASSALLRVAPAARSASMTLWPVASQPNSDARNRHSISLPSRKPSFTLYFTEVTLDQESQASARGRNAIGDKLAPHRNEQRGCPGGPGQPAA